MSLKEVLMLGQQCGYLVMAQSLHNPTSSLCYTTLSSLPTHSCVVLHCSHVHAHDILQHLAFYS